MKKTGLIFLLFAHQIISQNGLSVTGIPEILMQNMDAVVRYDNNELTIEGKNNYTFKRNWAVTVFNEIGESEFAAFKVNYDKFSKIKKIEGKIYDATGKELKALKNSDIKDYGMGSASDEITDNRIKVAEFDKKYYPYPYTVEFSYEERSSNMLFLPGWFPVEYDKIAVLKSTFSINCPTEIKYQKKELHLSKPSVVSTINNLKTEAWSLENYVSPKVESFIYEPQVPSVIIAPLDFTIEDFNGSANSWSDLAKFYHALNKNRDKLPEKTISEVQEIAKNEQTTEQKVKKIYEYVQAHTRYQSIQLGIGGWQTRLATEVAEKGYGDCKALTNYTIALLKAINIEAFPALIKAGEDAKLTIFFADSAMKVSELESFSKFNTELLVLSACKTNVGKVAKGEGTLSMAREFAGLGIPASLTTLWSVENEATYQITELFYKYLKSGEPKDIALQKAKLEYLEINSREKQDPKYWAAFVLMGETAPIQGFDGRIFYICLLILVLIVAALFFFMRHKRLKIK